MDFTYSAFISYRHLPADTAAAKAVQRALETYRIPGDIRKKTGKRKLNRCFRDQDELPLADDLGASIEKALNESEWLIVICTPDLPQSAWCLREVDRFISLGRRDRIIPVLVSGEPKNSYPPQITRAAPEEGSEEVEPLAADLRGNLKKQLRTEKLRIVARMLNLNFNDLKKREKERALRSGLIAVSCALAGALCLTAYAVYNNRLLTEERNAVARNATELLIEKSLRSTAEGEIGNGMSYALQAYSGSRIFADEYDTAVSSALEAAMYPELFSRIGSLKDNGVLHRWATLSSDGRLVACRQADNSLQVYSSVSGERLCLIRDYGWFLKSAPDFSPDSRYICRITETTADLFGSTDGTPAVSAALPDGWTVSFPALTSKNEIPVRTADGKENALYDPFSGSLSPLDGVTLSGTEADSVVLHRSGRRGAWSDGQRIRIVDTETGKVMRTLDSAVGEYTDDGWYFRWRDGEEYVFLRWDTLEEACRSRYPGALSPDGTVLACGNGTDGFDVRNARTGELLWSGGHNTWNTLYGLAFADDDTLIASHGEIQIYRISDQSVVYDSGEDLATYGYDFKSGRLVMPLRSGGCLVNLLPEDTDTVPRITVETRENCGEEYLAGITENIPLAGNWNGMVFSFFDGENWVSLEREEPGLVYVSEGREYVLHPVNGITASNIYLSPDGKWQALIRNEEVDVFRAGDGPEPVLTIPGNGYSRLCAAICGDVLALGAYVENLSFFDLNTGDCIGTVRTGAMCTQIQFSPDGKHIIALSATAAQATVANTENLATVMKIPVTDVYANPTVGFNSDGTEAVVLYPDGHADVGLLYQGLETLVDKARKYTE